MKGNLMMMLFRPGRGRGMLALAATFAACAMVQAIAADTAAPAAKQKSPGVEVKVTPEMTGAGIVAGLVYWMIAGRGAGAWREPPRGLRPPPPLPSQPL